MSEIQPTPIFNQDEILKNANNNNANKSHHHHHRGQPQSLITTPANSGNSGNLLQTTGTTQTFHEYATTCSNSIIDKLENLSMNNTIEINPASTQASSQNSEVFSHGAQNEMNDDQIAKDGDNDTHFNLKTSNYHNNDSQKFTTINQIESQNLTVHITSLSHEHLNSQKLNLDLVSNEPTTSNKINNLTDSQHSYITRTEEQSFISSLDPEHCFKLQRRRPCTFITPPNSTLKCGICQEIVCYPMVLECGHNACLYCINSNNRMGQSADQIGHHQNQNKINNNHPQLTADNRNMNQILNRNHYTEVNQVLSNTNNINFHLSNLGSVPPSHTQSAMIIPSLGLNNNNDQQTKMTPLDEIHSQYKNNNHQNLNLNFFQLKELNRFGRASLPRANNFQNRNKQFANMRDKNRDNAAIHHARIRGPISTDHGTTQNYNLNLQSSSHSIENILESHRTNLNLSPTNNNQNYNNNNNNSINRRSSKNSANNTHRQDSSNKAQLQLNQAQDITNNNNNKTSRHASDKFSLSGTGSDPEQVFCNICQKITNSTKIPSSAIQCQVMNLIIKCRNKSCSVTVKLCLRLIHEDKCQLEEVSCPNDSDCGIFLKRDLRSHLEVCKFFCCKYREFGCEFKGDKGEVDEHQKNCQYLVTEQASIYWFGVVFVRTILEKYVKLYLCINNKKISNQSGLKNLQVSQLPK